MLRCWLERFIASALFVVTSPILILVALGVMLTSGFPIFYRQERAGLDAKPFTIIKFRTMKELRDRDDRLLPDQDRITKFGKWLRKTSIDELPELLNIAKGEMAFVGPRPLPMAYVDRYSARELTRLSVLPGLTGWAQVHGRNEVDWDTRLEMDVWYVNHRSILLDLRIVLRTFKVVLSPTEITMNGASTMVEFRSKQEGDLE